MDSRTKKFKANEKKKWSKCAEASQLYDNNLGRPVIKVIFGWESCAGRKRSWVGIISTLKFLHFCKSNKN